MGLADSIRIMRGHLTEEERRERDVAAQARRAAIESSSPEVHRARVRKCSGLSAVILQCHIDTWQSALNVMSGPWLVDGKWTKDPADSVVRADEGLVKVRLSGAKLAELVSTLWYLPRYRRNDIYATPSGMEIGWKASPTPAQEEQANRLYHAIAAVVDRVQVNTPRQGGFPLVVIDDAVETS
ncbi:hypothetical protein [Micromonospora sp. NBC_01739]|uniref:hypothetical protein n=1 Tax=Micromonospora sp. NBC_01739 TaxID=2975985 RepID=UPI002E0E1ACF|nr:hypothetical protein OIE53_25480 [Micromonospora sp. NBC_01739]